MRNREAFITLMADQGIVEPPVLTFEELMLALPGLVAYWPMNETSGVTADNAEGTAARDGTYFNTPTLDNFAFPAGGKIPLFNGSNEGLNIYTASLASAFNPDKGWFMVWFRDPTPSGAGGYVFSLFADNANEIHLKRASAVTYEAAYQSGDDEAYLFTTSTYTGLHFFAMDWDQGTETYRYWWDGVRLTTGFSNGATPPMPAWVGSLDSTVTNVASWINSGNGSFPGNVGQAALGAGEVLSDDLVTELFNSVIPSTGQITFLGDSKTHTTGAWCGRVVGSIGNDTGILWRESPERMAWDGIDLDALLTNVNGVIGGLSGNPSTVCINIGVNDAASDLPAEAVWKGKLNSLIATLRTKWPAVQIYIARVWDRRDPTDCATINGWINDVIATQTYLHAGPNEAVWLENGDNGTTYTDDGTHYNAAGLVECASQWLTALGYV